MMEGHAPQVLGEYLGWWLEEVVAPRVRRRTHEHYAWAAEHIKVGLGSRQLDEVSPLDVEAWMAARRRAGLSGQSVFLARNALRRAYKDAIRYGLCAENPAGMALPPRREVFVIEPLTPVQAKVLLTCLRGHRREALYSVALALGMRRGEIAGLRWRDIDLDRGTILIRHQLQWVKGNPVWEPPKGRKRQRRISLPAVLVQQLREHRTRQVEERLRAGKRWQDHDLVFPRRDGQPYRGRSLLSALKRDLARAGLPDKRFHDLRHSCASLMFALGIDIAVISEILGHSDIATTRNIYVHLMPEMGQDAAKRIDRFFGEETGT